MDLLQTIGNSWESRLVNKYPYIDIALNNYLNFEDERIPAKETTIIGVISPFFVVV